MGGAECCCTAASGGFREGRHHKRGRADRWAGGTRVRSRRPWRSSCSPGYSRWAGDGWCGKRVGRCASSAAEPRARVHPRVIPAAARLEKLATPTSLAVRPRRSPPPPTQGKPWWWALCGSAALVAYGFVPCLQPLTDFGRLYAVYGGFFIALSYAWGAAFDGFDLDAGDVAGGCIALAGVLVALFWPGREGPSGTVASASS